MVRPALAVLAVSIAVAPLAAQDFTGTYRLNAGGGTTITLTLQQSRSGQITGTLQGNTSFQVQAQVGANGQFAGYAANQAGRLYLEGVLAGTQLQLAMAEVGADGQPQVATARTVTMDRVAAMGQAAPAAPQGGLLLGRRNAPPGSRSRSRSRPTRAATRSSHRAAKSTRCVTEGGAPRGDPSRRFGASFGTCRAAPP